MADTSSDNTLAILVHILGLFSNFVGALVVYLVAKDDITKKHSARALNWQISLAIYYTVAIILLIFSWILVFFIIGIILVPIFYIALFALAILNIIFSIIAAVKASQGELWKYPLTFRFVSEN